MILKAKSEAKGPFPKFMFDLDFDVHPRPKKGPRPDGEEPGTADMEGAEAMPEPEPEPEPAPPTYSEEDLAQTRAEGVAEGRRQAQEEAAATIEKQTADALSALTQQVTLLFQAQAEANDGMVHDAVAVAAALVRKLFPSLNQATAVDEMETMLKQALDRLAGEPSIAVRVPAELAEPMHERVDAVVALSSFKGDVRVIGDAALAVGDCRLEWTAGGVQRSAAELIRDLDAIIRQNIGAPAADEAAETEMAAAAEAPAATDEPAATAGDMDEQPTV